MHFFYFNDTATTEIYTLSHTTLFRSQRDRHTDHWQDHNQDQHRHIPPLWPAGSILRGDHIGQGLSLGAGEKQGQQDRKSTRLNSSHSQISYAVFCLKKKKTKIETAPD